MATELLIETVEQFDPETDEIAAAGLGIVVPLDKHGGQPHAAAVERFARFQPTPGLSQGRFVGIALPQPFVPEGLGFAAEVGGRFFNRPSRAQDTKPSSFHTS